MLKPPTRPNKWAFSAKYSDAQTPSILVWIHTLPVRQHLIDYLGQWDEFACELPAK